MWGAVVMWGCSGDVLSNGDVGAMVRCGCSGDVGQCVGAVVMWGDVGVQW